MTYRHGSKIRETCSCGAVLEYEEHTEFALSIYIHREFEQQHKGCLEAEATDSLISDKGRANTKPLRELAPRGSKTK